MRSLIVQIAFSAALLGVGCGDARTVAPDVTNAASIPPAPKAAVPAEAADTSLTVSGPIIVEHQVDVTAQRDGVLAKISYDAPARVKAGTGELCCRKYLWILVSHPKQGITSTM